MNYFKLLLSALLVALGAKLSNAQTPNFTSYYTIQNGSTQQVLSTKGKKEQAAFIYGDQDIGNDTQWKIISQGNGTVHIRNRGSELYLANFGSTVNKTFIKQTGAPGAGAVWRLEELADGSFKIISNLSGMLLSLDKSSYAIQSKRESEFSSWRFIETDAAFNEEPVDALSENFVHFGTKRLERGARRLNVDYANNNVVFVDYEDQGNNSCGDYPITVKDGEWRIYNSYNSYVYGAHAAMMAFKPCENAYTHTSTKENTTKLTTILDSPLLNGKKEAILIVTKRGDNHGKIKNHAVFYDESSERWHIYSVQGKKMLTDVEFSVLVLHPGRDITFIPKHSGMTLTADQVNITANGDVGELDQSHFGDLNSKYFTTIVTESEFINSDLNFKLVRNAEGKYSVKAMSKEGHYGPVPDGLQMNILRVQMTDDVAAIYRKREDENLEKELILVKKEQIAAQEEREAKAEEWAERVESMKKGGELAKKREEEDAARREEEARKQEQLEKQREQEAQNAEAARLAYRSNSLPVAGTRLARPCAGESIELEFSWDALTGNKGYTIKCFAVDKASDMEREILTKFTNETHFTYTLEHSALIDKATELKYEVKAHARHDNKKYPEGRSLISLPLENCIPRPTFTSPVPYSNPSMPNAGDGSSTWNYEWAKVNGASGYEFQIFVEKSDGKRIDFQEITPTPDTKFGFTLGNGFVIQDEDASLPARFDKWYARVRAVRGDSKGPWSYSLKFQIDPIKHKKQELPISNTNIQPTSELVVIRHLGAYAARYVVEFDQWMGSKWVRQSKPVKLRQGLSGPHQVEIPGNAINIRITGEKLNMEFKYVNFMDIKLPKATTSMQYVSKGTLGNANAVHLSELNPPNFEDLLAKATEKIIELNDVISVTGEHIARNLMDAEVRKKIKSDIQYGDYQHAFGPIYENVFEQALKNAAEKTGIHVKTLTVGVGADASVIIGSNLEFGMAVPLDKLMAGKINNGDVLGYIAPAFTIGFSFGVDASVTLSLWSVEPSELSGSTNGIVMGYANAGVAGAVTVWFDNETNFIGFSVSMGVGLPGVEAELVKALTIVPKQDF